MTHHWWSAGAALLLLTAIPQGAQAQSLGDVAQREVERRKQVAAGREYTNADLAPTDAAVPSPAPPAPAAAGPAPVPEAPATPPAAKPTDNPGVEPVLVKGRETRDEEYWRGLVRGLRARMAKATADGAAQEARLAAIDAAPQTPASTKEREIISGAVTRLQRDARFLSDELERFLTRARAAKVPEEWIR